MGSLSKFFKSGKYFFQAQKLFLQAAAGSLMALWP
jgi:hypothetical protein